MLGIKTRVAVAVAAVAVGASFVQQECFLAGVHGLHSGHSDEVAIRDGGGLGPQGRQHLSAVVVGGVGKHVLESVGLGQQQPDLLIAPVDRGQVLQQHEEALQGKGGFISLQPVPEGYLLPDPVSPTILQPRVPSPLFRPGSLNVLTDSLTQ